MCAPLMETEQDGSVRIQDLTKVVMDRRRLGLTKERHGPCVAIRIHFALEVIMRRAFVAFFLLTLSTFVAPAAADPIQVTYGYMQWDQGDPWVFFARGAGFEAGSVPVGEPAGGAFADPRSICADASPCLPGTRFSLDASYSGAYLGSGTWQADSNRTVYFDGTFDFTAGSGTVPGRGWVYSPFVFTGTLAGYDNIDRTGTPLFTQPLFGTGRCAGAQHSADASAASWPLGVRRVASFIRLASNRHRGPVLWQLADWQWPARKAER